MAECQRLVWEGKRSGWNLNSKMLISRFYEKFYGIEIIKYYLIEMGKYGDVMEMHVAFWTDENKLLNNLEFKIDNFIKIFVVSHP